jgi:hypothetical protein
LKLGTPKETRRQSIPWGNVIKVADIYYGGQDFRQFRDSIFIRPCSFCDLTSLNWLEVFQIGSESLSHLPPSKFIRIDADATHALYLSGFVLCIHGETQVVLIYKVRMSLCYSEREWPGLEVKLEIEKMKKKKPSALFFLFFSFLVRSRESNVAHSFSFFSFSGLERGGCSSDEVFRQVSKALWLALGKENQVSAYNFHQYLYLGTNRRAL